MCAHVIPLCPVLSSRENPNICQLATMRVRVYGCMISYLVSHNKIIDVTLHKLPAQEREDVCVATIECSLNIYKSINAFMHPTLIISLYRVSRLQLRTSSQPNIVHHPHQSGPMTSKPLQTPTHPSFIPSQTPTIRSSSIPSLLLSFCS